jgi:[ribosomal protein S18]-alanine N-acetyltransferase
LSLHIRAMTEQDLDQVLRLTENSVEAPHWTRPEYQRMLRNTPANPVQRCSLVALRDDAFGGFVVASWLRHDPAAEVEGLMVDARYRRQGIGSVLIGACMAWAAEAGASSIRLEVRTSNGAALALYRRQGFSATGSRRAYYSHPVEDAVLLEALLMPGVPGTVP